MSSNAEPPAQPAPTAGQPEAAAHPSTGVTSPVEPAAIDPEPPVSEPEGPATIVTVWSPTTPARRPKFADDRITSYRHPSERPALLLGLLVIALVAVVAFLTGTVHYAGLGLLGIWLTMMTSSAQQRVQHLASSVQVSRDHLPRVHRIVRELGRRFSMPKLTVMADRNLGMVMRSTGFREPYVIAVGTTLVEMLTDDELRFMLGREMGHIKLGHTRLQLLLGSHAIQLPAALSVVSQLRSLVFASLDRAQALSADRIGVVACGKVDHALSTIAKLTLGARGAASFRLEVLEPQAQELASGTSRLSGQLVLWQAQEVPLVYRVRDLIAWAGLPDPPPPKAASDSSDGEVQPAQTAPTVSAQAAGPSAAPASAAAAGPSLPAAEPAATAQPATPTLEPAAPAPADPTPAAASLPTPAAPAASEPAGPQPAS